MHFLFVMGKVFASILLVILFITSLFKANPKTHNPEHGHKAEYLAGFICFFWGFGRLILSLDSVDTSINTCALAVLFTNLPLKSIHFQLSVD